MGVALKLYIQLTEASDDKSRARIIAEAFDQLEERCAGIKEIATQRNIREDATAPVLKKEQSCYVKL